MTVAVYPTGIRVHRPALCESDGYACPFHRPSDHHMVGWPIYIRTDKGALVERICEHGVGHPDPDSVRHLVRTTGDTYFASHGCDGCCRLEIGL